MLYSKSVAYDSDMAVQSNVCCGHNLSDWLSPVLLLFREWHQPIDLYLLTHTLATSLLDNWMSISPGTTVHTSTLYKAYNSFFLIRFVFLQIEDNVWNKRQVQRFPWQR